MLAITKGELSVIRSALEEGGTEERQDALEIVNAITDKNVKVFITEDRMFQASAEGDLTQDEINTLLTEPLDMEDLEDADLDLEEEHRVC